MRIGVAGFAHETNSFALEQNDALDAEVWTGQEIVSQAHPKSFVGGFLEGAAAAGVEVVPAVQVHPIHRGLIRADVYAHYRRLIVDALRQAARQRPLDGVYFALHGAMTAEAPYVDGEGALLQAARQALGDIPFVATYDFHGIMTEPECALLAAAFPND